MCDLWEVSIDWSGPLGSIAMMKLIAMHIAIGFHLDILAMSRTVQLDVVGRGLVNDELFPHIRCSRMIGNQLAFRQAGNVPTVERLEGESWFKISAHLLDFKFLPGAWLLVLV